MKNIKNYIFNSIAIIFLALSLIFQALTISKLSDRIEKLEEVKSVEVNKQEIIQNDPPWSVVPSQFYIGTISIPYGHYSFPTNSYVVLPCYINFNYSVGLTFDTMNNTLNLSNVTINLSYSCYFIDFVSSQLIREYRYSTPIVFDMEFSIPYEDNSNYYLPMIYSPIDLSTGNINSYMFILDNNFNCIEETISVYGDNTLLQDMLVFFENSWSSFYDDYVSTIVGDYGGSNDTSTINDFSWLSSSFYQADPYTNPKYNNPFYLTLNNNAYNSNVAAIFGNGGEGGGGGADDGYTQADLDQAYNSGFQAGEKSKNTFTLAWLGDIFDVVGQILSVEIFYGFKLWYFVGIIGIIGVIYGVMKLWR